MARTVRLAPFLAALPLIALGLWIADRAAAPVPPERPPEAPAKAGAPEPLPSAAAVGAARRSGIERYAGDGVYTYLDGGAEAYLSRGLEAIAVARYTVPAAGGGEGEIEAAAMRFRTARGAEAQWTALAPRGAEPVEGVPGAILGRGELVALRGRWLLHAVAYDPDAVDREALVRLAAAWSAMAGRGDGRG